MQAYATPRDALILDRPEREYVLALRDLPEEGRPREKLIAHGPAALTMQELLAVVLALGTSREDVLGLSRRLIREYGEKSALAETDPRKLARESRISLIKACQIVACGELGKRAYGRGASGFVTVRNAREAYEYLSDMRSLKKEHLRGLYLNSHNRIIRDEVISIGTVNASIVHPREVFRPAIECSAVAVILAHNHPSGEAMPSAEDVEITKQIVRAGKVLGIAVLDHVVIARDSFASVGTDYS